MDITADSRYVLYINGEYVGQGPVRAWPAHWRYDTYDIAPYLCEGNNSVAVLVNHFGEGNFQYIPAPPGLLARIDLGTGSICTNSGWRALPYSAFTSSVPRISVQQGFEEQFDARLDDGWTSPDYDDRSWLRAAELRPAEDGIHRDLAPRGIPYLTSERVLPRRVVSIEAIRSLPHVFTVYTKPYFTPEDMSSNVVVQHGYLATQIWSDEETAISFAWCQPLSEIKVNGLETDPKSIPLKKGWNSFVMRRPCDHCYSVAMCFDGPEWLKFRCKGDGDSSPWAIVGPFGLREEDIRFSDEWVGDIQVIVNPECPGSEAGIEFWNSGDVAEVAGSPWFWPVARDHLAETNVFVAAYTDRVVGSDVKIDSIDGLLSGSEWTTTYPDPDGNDVRILLDFGQEVLGYHTFEVEASEGTIIDFHNFEFIQPDGRYNFAEEMNNSFRYICRDGRQSYRTHTRRGFRYSYFILRNMAGPVKLRRVEVIFTTYPQSRRGSFTCSDWQVNRIWEVGAHSLRCCSEDTYTDCPTYEQAHWMGDARNEALVDWVINGDPRLWYRCLEQAGDSLDRSPIIESHVPSAWQNVLPAWSFLWMRSCREYLLFTGDAEHSRKLLGYIERNVEGVRSHIDDRNLFSIRAWNMFDWAEMDTPPRGVVTHQNCFAVLALKDTADMADQLGRSDLADDWRKLADVLVRAINEHLWNDEKQAYTDCLRAHPESAGGSAHSLVFSQQTQTIAYISGVAHGERGARCRDILFNPPVGFVKAGSPFFEFFLLEALQDENCVQEFIDTIRKDWGFMVDMGATTFWEMWSDAEVGTGQPGRLTRSHCHGWSAAPTYFLSTYVLGVRPGGPRFAPAIIEPHPGDITWCRGVVPAPQGDIEVHWNNEPDKPFVLRYKAPEGMDVRIQLPRAGEIITDWKKR